MPQLYIQTGGAVDPFGDQYIPRPIDQALDTRCGQGQWVILSGPRQKGKSTALLGVRGRMLQDSHWVTICEPPVGYDPLVGPEGYIRELLELIVNGTRSRVDQRESSAELVADFEQWQASVAHQPYLTQFHYFFERFLLPRVPHGKRFVWLLDEADRMLATDVSDNIMLKLRELHEQRANTPALAKLSLVLAGYDPERPLIHDTSKTPFNVAEILQPEDLTTEDLLEKWKGVQLVAGVKPEQNEELLRQVHEATQGQPGLFMSLLKFLQEHHPNPARWNRDMVEIAYRQHFPRDKRESDQFQHFSRIHEMLTREGEHFPSSLELYQRALTGNKPWDLTSPASKHLQATGVVKNVGKSLVVHNKVYRWMFDEEWCAAKLPPPPTPWVRLRRFLSRNKRELAIALLGLCFLGMAAIAYRARGDAERAEASRAKGSSIRAGCDLRERSGKHRDQACKRSGRGREAGRVRGTPERNRSQPAKNSCTEKQRALF